MPVRDFSKCSLKTVRRFLKRFTARFLYLHRDIKKHEQTMISAISRRNVLLGGKQWKDLL